MLPCKYWTQPSFFLKKYILKHGTKATACKFVVKLCCDLALIYGTENSNKWPLTKVVKTARKVFITSHHTDLFAFTQKPTEKSMWQLDRSCPQTMPQSLKCQSDRAENFRRGVFRACLLAGQSGNPTLCEGKGRLICTLQFADGSAFLSNVVQDSLATLQLETEVVAYILAGWLFMYLPWILTWASHIPKPPTYPPKPDGTRQSNRKRQETLETLSFLRYEFTICLAKLCLWIKGWGFSVRSSTKKQNKKKLQSYFKFSINLIG